MTKLPFKVLFPAAAVALLLAGCGGGGGDFSNEPRSSTRPASATVANSVDTSLNGGYATSDVFLNDVEKVQLINQPEYCKIRFANLPKTGSTQLVMDGDVRYKPGTTEMTVAFISINTIAFTTTGPAGATVDRTNNQINFTNAIFTSTQGTGRTLVFSGTIPIRAENKPEGC